MAPRENGPVGLSRLTAEYGAGRPLYTRIGAATNIITGLLSSVSQLREVANVVCEAGVGAIAARDAGARGWLAARNVTQVGGGVYKYEPTPVASPARHQQKKVELFQSMTTFCDSTSREERRT